LADEPAEPVIEAHPSRAVLLLVAIGGAIGALARYGLTRVIHVPTNGFPRATFVTNLSGAFALGVLLTVIHERRLAARYSRPLIAIGFLGAYTTFSTMAVETVTLIKDGHAGVGFAYLFLSIALGLAVCALGVILARAVARTRAAGVV
jgi:CrcB protein